ncbi:hypothetical protein TNIN_217861 [Trichonephila inaurata madagascariensis]|uniref:Uncharacterized protein n=1 Tax=Trichonephila inaurata madagascariensis TaxID=2747483 RepID=A0A8X6XPU8_9ARAC|nr:hypothetical protein TNIN_217861 [Trichonephila inaurata madagascariensis]
MAPLLVGAGAPPEWRPRFLVSLRSVCRGTRQQHAVLDAVGGHARRPRHVDGAPAEASAGTPQAPFPLPLKPSPGFPQVSQEAAQRKKR